jgi:osmotically inducible lipoprotein OsmB
MGHFELFCFIYQLRRESMKKSTGAICMFILAASLLTGCADMNRRDAGMLGGAAVGGLAGNALTGGSTLGTVAGAAGGAYLGRHIVK